MPNYERAFSVACADIADELGLDLGTLRTAVFAASDRRWRGTNTYPFFHALGIESPTTLLSDLPGDFQECDDARAWKDRYRLESWSDGLAACGVKRSVETLASRLDRTFREALRRRCDAYPDCAPALRALARYRLAVLTNGPADVQRTKLETSGLAPFFEFVVASGDVGFGKPHPRMFQIALERLGITPPEAIAIGDSRERDVVGATAAGVECIVVERDSASDPLPTYHASSFADVPTLVDSIASHTRQPWR